MAESVLQPTEIPAATAPPSEAKRPEGRMHLNYLDGIRGLAALYVLMHHVTTHLKYPNTDMFQKVLATVFKFGHYSVDVFIVLSGFCLMIPICNAGGKLKGGSRNFFKRRAHRILPTYYAAMAVSLLLIYFFIGQKTGTHWDVAIPVSRSCFWDHVFLIQDMITNVNDKINFAMWSISVEWRIYFLFPFLVLAFYRFGGIRVAVLTCIASYILLHLLRRYTLINTDTWGVSPTYIGLFAVGMLGCEMTLGRLRNWVPSKTAFLSFLVVGSCVLAAVSFSPYYYKAQLISFISGPVAAALMVTIGRGYLPIGNLLFSWKPIAFLGTMGYSLYLFHAPLLQLTWVSLIRPFNFSPQVQQALLVAAVPVIIGGCYLAFLLFEKPVLRSMKARKKPAVSVATA